MLQHELGALEVVDLTIWLDEVRAHFVDVIDDDEFVLLFIRTRRKIDEEPVILLNIVAVLDVDLLAHHLVRHCLSMIDLGLLGRLSKKVVYMSQSDEISACRDDEKLTFHLREALLVESFASEDEKSTAVKALLRLGHDGVHQKLNG